MVKIRFRRTGAKKKASYRIVVTPSTAPRDGRFIEIIGHYQPRENPPVLVVQEDRLFHWLSVGAQPTDSLYRLLQSQGYLDRFAQYKAGESTLDEAAQPAPVAEPETTSAAEGSPEEAVETA